MASAAEQLAASINFSAIGRAEELKKRIWFTLGALIIYRLGTYIPLPGIDPVAFEASFTGKQQGVLELFNMFAGGAVQRMAIFALNIMPYISASIIIQLLASMIPALEQMKKEGDQGRKASHRIVISLAYCRPCTRAPATPSGPCRFQRPKQGFTHAPHRSSPACHRCAGVVSPGFSPRSAGASRPACDPTGNPGCTRPPAIGAGRVYRSVFG